MSERNDNEVTAWQLLTESRYGIKQRVPKFQRNYSWESRHVKQFFEDIAYDMRYYAREPNSYGVIIGVYDRTNRVFRIVDGQQRLGTLQILIFSIRLHLVSLGNSLSQQIGEVGKSEQILVYNNRARFGFNHDDKDNWNNNFIARRDDDVQTVLNEIEERKGLDKDTKIDNAFVTLNNLILEDMEVVADKERVRS